jgi:hypothetical protein
VIITSYGVGNVTNSLVIRIQLIVND